MTVNERIIRLSEMIKVNQTDLAIVCDVSKQAMSAIFRKETKPSLKIVENIVKKYPHVNARWLLTGEGDATCTNEYQIPDPVREVADNKTSYECSNCKLLREHIDRQNKLIDHYEKQYSQKQNAS